MSDGEIMKIAESWLNTELRRIPAKLGLTPTQMMRVVVSCTANHVESYLKTVKAEEDAAQSPG